MVGGASKFRCSRINDSLADDDGITADRRRDKLPVLRRHCQPVKLGRPISGLCSGTNTVSAWLNSRAICRMTRFRSVGFEHQGERVASKSG